MLIVVVIVKLFLSKDSEFGLKFVEMLSIGLLKAPYPENCATFPLETKTLTVLSEVPVNPTKVSSALIGDLKDIPPAALILPVVANASNEFKFNPAPGVNMPPNMLPLTLTKPLTSSE